MSKISPWFCGLDSPQLGCGIPWDWGERGYDCYTNVENGICFIQKWHRLELLEIFSPVFAKSKWRRGSTWHLIIITIWGTIHLHYNWFTERYTVGEGYRHKLIKDKSLTIKQAFWAAWGSCCHLRKLVSSRSGIVLFGTFSFAWHSI